ncbi:MAG: hypothetical protein L3K52_02025 [Candidatus Thiothrix sulfatifontis]|nr:MAG: hypothetical protein L3K52_02025 [Candidatus Thiothrix sulfatifontis]
MELTTEILRAEAARFAALESQHPEPSLFGVTDGKTVGTYLKHKFRSFFRGQGYQFEEDNSANGIDFPGLLVDMKVISTDRSQSSCPFKSPRQKVYGLGYSLIIFVYDKTDDEVAHAVNLIIANTIFVAAERTADFKMTKGIRNILENEGNQDDVVAFLSDSYLLQDEEQLDSLAKELVKHKPEQGYLNMPRQLDCWSHFNHTLTNNRLIGAVSL